MHSGDWTVIEGAYFDCWRYEQHVVQPFEVPAHWARFRAMDWGSAKPFSVGWWAIVSDDHYVPRAEGSPDRLLTRGALVRYREWYGAASPNVGLKMTAEAVGAGMAQRESSIPICGTGCSIPRALRRTAGPRSRSGSTRSLLRLVCAHFTPRITPASRTGGRWVAGISYAPASSDRTGSP